jgi:class 3 adenylate cyclase/tetratricopeptide (TPR) repeat protein
MTPLEEKIAAIRADIAKLETEASARVGEQESDASLTLLRSQLAQLQASASSQLVGSRESERKVVTILFADISGFTALSETLDPEEARELVDAFFQRMTPIIEKYHGTIEKFIGDEIMAVFGAPVASENDAECALRTALEMLEEFTRFASERDLHLGVHFGINTGLVIAGSIGTGGQAQYAVTGDAVNVASRFRDAAGRNQIYVGRDTYRLTSALFEFESRPPIEAKGKTQPLEVFSLIKARVASSPLRGLPGIRSPLVGREREFERLALALRELGQGRGSALAILGEAGLGKSRLVAEVHQNLGSETRWVETRAVSYGERLSYGVARGLIEGLAGISGDGSAENSATLLRARVEALFPTRTEEVFPYLAHLCHAPLDESMAERVKYLAPEALHGQIVRSFQEYVRAAASSRPLTLVWEDLHWIDASSLRLLETLLPVTVEMPLLLLVVARSFDEGGLPAFSERTSSISGVRWEILNLSPLSRESSSELVKNLLRIEDRSIETPELVLEKAEGNPFFLEELLRGLMEAGLVTLGQSYGSTPSRAQEVEVPRTLQGLIASRIDRLAVPDKRVLETAAVIGRVFQRRVLDHLAPREGESARLESSLGELEERELIRRRQSERFVSDREYIFKHVMTQEVTYQGVSLARRRALHRMTAEAIEALFPDRLGELSATLAYHYEKAEESERAIHYLTKAAAVARRSYANDKAIKFTRAALRQAERLRSKQENRWAELAPGMHESLGETLLSAGRYEDAREALQNALIIVGESDLVRKSRLLRKQGNAWYQQRRMQESLGSYDQAEAALGPRPGDENASWWKEWLAIGLDRSGPYYHFNRLTELAELLQQIQPAAKRFGTPSQRRDALDALTLIEVRQCRYHLVPDSALGRAQDLLAESRETGELNDAAHYQFEVGFILLHRDELEPARDALEAALKLSARIGDVATQTKCLTYLGLAHRKLLHVAETERYATLTIPWRGRLRIPSILARP